MVKPSSFSSICTSNCAFELVGLLLSLSVFHPNEKMFIICDTKTKTLIDNMTPQPRLQITWFIELDKYEVKILPQRWGVTPWGFIEDNPEWSFLTPHLLPTGNHIPKQPDVWC